MGNGDTNVVKMEATEKHGENEGSGIAVGSRICRDVAAGKEVHYEEAAVPADIGDERASSRTTLALWMLITLGELDMMNREGSRTRAEIVPVDGDVEVEGADEDGVGQGEKEGGEEAHTRRVGGSQGPRN